MSKYTPNNEQVTVGAKDSIENFEEFPEEDIEQTIPERFEKVVREYPDRTAVKMGDRALTYDQLNRAANRIARAILEKRGPVSEPIALLFEHGIDVIAASLGVWKAGKFIVAMDTSFPSERIDFILTDSQTGLFLTNELNSKMAANHTHQERTLLSIDGIDQSTSSENLSLPISPNDLRILRYTSGSTGKPKGVMYSHKSLFRGFESHSISHEDRLSLLHSVAFGSANAHLFLSLLNGASLFPFDIKSAGIHNLANWLIQEEITMLHIPPAAFRQLGDIFVGQANAPKLRLIRLSGAPITSLDFELYKKHFCSTTLLEIRMSATETRAIGRAVVGHDFAFPEKGTPAGYPAPGTKVLLLDEDGCEVGPGEVGEIAVKSRGLSDGYWRSQELDSSKFLKNPGGGDERIFLTGDLGRMLPDGFLIHLGRKDLMVKIRGYRVEIGEVEEALLAHPNVKEAGVAAWDRDGGEQYLAAYIVPREGVGPTVDELRGYLRQKLPDYMLPWAFMYLESLPLTNGKLDRKALPEPENKRPEMKTLYESPRNEVELELVRIWEKVLAVCPIGVHDKFFDLGGHSLAATRVVSRVIEQFQLEIPFQSLFQSPTVADMAAVITDYEDKRLGEKELEAILDDLESLSDEEAQKLLQNTDGKL
jgi:amino acid adenylation domain-containing protein